MRKKTAPPRVKHRKAAASEKKSGLIAQKKTAGKSERVESVLDNRSHRTWGLFRARELFQDGSSLIHREHDRQTRTAFGAQHLATIAQVRTKHVTEQEEQRREGLVLGGSRHPLATGQ